MQVRIAGNEATVPSPFRLLILEDTAADAELEQLMLRRAGLTFTAHVVATEANFVAALSAFRPDLIIVDYRVPGFGGCEAARISGAEYPGRPIILVTGVLTDEAGAELLKTGISDYVLKDHLARLPAVVIAALRDAEETRKRQSIWETHDELARILERADGLSFSATHADDGTSKGASIIVRDITRQKRLRHTVAGWTRRRSAMAMHDESAPVGTNNEILAALERQFGAEKGRRFVSIASSKIQEVVGELRDCRDRSVTAHALHDLVSIAGNVGLQELSELARQLMNAFRQDSADTALQARLLASAEAALAQLGNQGSGWTPPKPLACATGD